MKKHGVLNSDLAKVVDDLGHCDRVCIGDLGLPIPSSVEKIDLALRYGFPSFQDVLDIYLENVFVERVYLAQEIQEVNPMQHKLIQEKLPAEIEICYLPHEELKALMAKGKAVVRTGEVTPYSNIILESGALI